MAVNDRDRPVQPGFPAGPVLLNATKKWGRSVRGARPRPSDRYSGFMTYNSQDDCSPSLRVFRGGSTRQRTIERRTIFPGNGGEHDEFRLAEHSDSTSGAPGGGSHHRLYGRPLASLRRDLSAVQARSAQNRGGFEAGGGRLAQRLTRSPTSSTPRGTAAAIISRRRP